VCLFLYDCSIFFLYTSSTISLDAVATDLFDIYFMANNIRPNTFVQSVSADLKPLYTDLIPDVSDACPLEYIIDPFKVESELSRIDARKSSGPDELPIGS